MLMKEGINAKQKEINVYEKVIAEIEASYEHILYSEDFYVEENSQNYWKESLGGGGGGGSSVIGRDLLSDCW